MLSVTPAHAFLKVLPFGEDLGGAEWVAAGQLQKGDYLRSASGVVSVDSVFTESVTPTPVLSYELEGGFDYMVGEMPVVVGGTCDLKTLKDALKNVPNAYGDFLVKIKSLNLTPAQRTALLAETARLQGSKLTDFITAFKTDANFAQGIAQDASLIQHWKGIGFLTTLKNDITFLKALKKTKDNTSLLKHLIGEVSNSGKAGGCHFYQSTLTNKARKSLNKPFVANSTIKDGSPNITEYAFKGTSKEMERTWIDIKDANGQFVPKTSNHSSFFPTAWSEQKIIEEIALAYKNRQPMVGASSNTFVGACSEGFDIEFFVKTDGTDDLITAFPSRNIIFQP
jgi:hypothetical protein